MCRCVNRSISRHGCCPSPRGSPETETLLGRPRSGISGSDKGEAVWDTPLRSLLTSHRHSSRLVSYLSFTSSSFFSSIHSTCPRRCSHLQLDRLPGPSANPNHGSNQSISKPCYEPKQTNPADHRPHPSLGLARRPSDRLNPPQHDSPTSLSTTTNNTTTTRSLVWIHLGHSDRPSRSRIAGIDDTTRCVTLHQTRGGNRGHGGPEQ